MTKENYLKDISEIKDMMNKSSRFISLSGLSGVLTGIYALIGAAYAYTLTHSERTEYNTGEIFGKIINEEGFLKLDSDLFITIVIILFSITFLSITTGIFLTYRKTQKTNVKFWDSTSKRLIINFLIPLVAGCIYILIILSQQKYGQIGALMLLFYGLALVNASKYTLGDIKYLGYTEIILGLLCAYFPNSGFWFWVVGFGFMHIIYGLVMYNKYDKV